MLWYKTALLLCGVPNARSARLLPQLEPLVSHIIQITETAPLSPLLPEVSLLKADPWVLPLSRCPLLLPVARRKPCAPYSPSFS